MQPSCPKGEIMSLMPYSSDAPGLYECIQRSSAYGIPVYVTETGFPTFNDDHMQTVLDRYLKEVSCRVLYQHVGHCNPSARTDFACFAKQEDLCTTVRQEVVTGL